MMVDQQSCSDLTFLHSFDLVLKQHYDYSVPIPYLRAPFSDFRPALLPAAHILTI